MKQLSARIHETAVFILDNILVESLNYVRNNDVSYYEFQESMMIWSYITMESFAATNIRLGKEMFQWEMVS